MSLVYCVGKNTKGYVSRSLGLGSKQSVHKQAWEETHLWLGSLYSGRLSYLFQFLRSLLQSGLTVAIFLEALAQMFSILIIDTWEEICLGNVLPLGKCHILRKA